MNNLKKVGLTALATTLVSTASVAGELSVSGSAALSYTGLSTNSSVNPWAMGDSVKFNGGGDLDNGMTVSVYYELDGGTYDDYNLKLGMGDMGTLSFSGNSSSGSGVDKLKDIVPNAYTPVYEATDATDSGLIDASGNNQTGQWGYDVSVAGFDLSASYNPKGTAAGTKGGAETGYAVKYSGLMDGLTLSAGYFDVWDKGAAEKALLLFGRRRTGAGVQLGADACDLAQKVVDQLTLQTTLVLLEIAFVE